MAGKRIGPNLVGVRAKIPAKYSLELRILNFAALDRCKHATGIFQCHRLKPTFAAPEAVEGNTLKEHAAAFVNVKIREHAAISKAHAEPTRPRRHRWVNLSIERHRFCRTSKMSHDGSWRAACLNRIWIRILHFEAPSVARGVTAPGVGSGALFGSFVLHGSRSQVYPTTYDNPPATPLLQ